MSPLNCWCIIITFYRIEKHYHDGLVQDASGDDINLDTVRPTSPVFGCPEALFLHDIKAAEHTFLQDIQPFERGYHNLLTPLGILDGSGWSLNRRGEHCAAVTSNRSSFKFLTEDIHETHVLPGFACIPKTLFRITVIAHHSEGRPPAYPVSFPLRLPITS
ncbi:unnamed protein product [Trypanosoma congolense IL3000]|uniref:WGS project CAEQ00000000 data, annotated contig 1173 n=1 Tax=Trypanosoma congolense (strain IL3000) TaxID=1068625 RepID=F9W4D6_TRYCI|nr:unnamed protein product [Trypanosoma congolense IL3000]